MTAIRKKWKGSEVVAWRDFCLRCEGSDRRHEQDLRVASDTVDNETGQLLIINLPVSQQCCLFFIILP